MFLLSNMNYFQTRHLILWLTLSLSSLHSLAAPQCISLFEEAAGKPAYRFQNNDASHTLSQQVRDNHLDYNYFVKTYPQKIRRENPELYSTLMRAIQHKGWVAGDNHSGNYIVAPVKGKMRYYFADIKDGGLGPVFYNFANLVLNTHAVTKRTDSAKIYQVADLLIDSYLKGLKGETVTEPTAVREALQTTMAEYRKMQTEDVERFLNSSQSGFDFSKKSIEALPNRSARVAQMKADMTAALQATGVVKTVLDFAIRLKERGGSKDLDRYWALVETKSGDLRILEFKEINIPAAQVVQASGLSLRAHTEKMMEVYFPDKDPTLQPVELNGQLFMMRPRKIDLISVPYKQKNTDQVVELLTYARYAAYQTGLKQALTTPTLAAYIKLIESEPAKFQLLIRQLVKDYYARLEDKVASTEIQD
jgi:hypothetical protein